VLIFIQHTKRYNLQQRFSLASYPLASSVVATSAIS
jgi:hypothetical protein